MERQAVVAGVANDAVATPVVEFAAREARRRGVPLHIVHSWRIGPRALLEADRGDDRDPLASRARRELAEIVSRSSLDDIEVETFTVEDAPSTVLLHRAQTASLLVVGSLRYGRPAEFLLGSVARECARHAWCPTVVVGELWSPVPITHIVAGHDATLSGRRSLRFAASEAVACNGELTIVAAGSHPTAFEDVREVVDEEIGETGARYSIERHVGDAAAEILEVAERAQLIVVSSTAAAPLPAVLTRSVGRSLVKNARMPVAFVGEPNPWRTTPEPVP